MGRDKDVESEEGNSVKELEEEIDPWDLPELNVKTVPWSELTFGGKVWRVTWGFLRIVLLIGFLYMFICSLDFLGTAFKLLGGKTAGKAFRETELLSNPIAGLMVGVLVTVLVQSSSTSTSIIITMVGAELLNVKQAVFIIMGANIGTTVTNTIVSLAQATEKNEFRRAFGAATVHDMFNWLTVLILLPIEWASGMLQRLTDRIIDLMHLKTYEDTKKDILKVLTKPFTKLIIKIDKKVIETVAKTKTDAELKKALEKDILVTFCSKKGDAYNVTEEILVPCSGMMDNVTAGMMDNVTTGMMDNVTTGMMDNVTTTVSDTVTSAMGMVGEAMTTANSTFNSSAPVCTELVNETKIEHEKIIYRCHNLFAQGKGDFKLSDGAAGGILLVVAIIILCICLASIVKLLQSIFKGSIARIIRKFLNNDFPGHFACLTGYVAILVGAGLTIIVQSSSIFTSTLTPLVGVGVIKLDRMYPLTLGSNIGTTTTGILAALASDGDKLKNTLQLAFCHLFFNIIGILIWYPIPYLRRFPIYLAKCLGNTTAEYRWFALVYLFFMFFILPAAIFGLSLAGWHVLLAVGGPILILVIFVITINIMQSKCSSFIHPAKLRSWQWLPAPLRSLKPLDDVFRRFCCRCRCCRAMCPEATLTEDDVMIEAETSNNKLSNGKDNFAFQSDKKQDIV